MVLTQIGPNLYFEENRVGVWLKLIWISSRDLNKEKIYIHIYERCKIAIFCKILF